MNVIVIALIAVGGFALLITFIFIYFNKSKGSGKKYPFLLYNRDGTRATEINAKVRIDPENKSAKCFAFEGYDTKIAIKEPTFFMGSKWFREVKIGKKGELVLLSGHTIDEDDYVKTSMNSEEVTVLTSTIIENNREFNNPLEKSTATLVVSMAIIAFLIVIGSVYSVVTLVGNSEEMLEIAKENTKNVNSLERIATANTEITAQLTTIASMLLGENYTRRIE